MVCLVFEERRIAAQHDVGDDPTRPQILGSTGFCLSDHLRYYIAGVEDIIEDRGDLTSGAR